jgi:predicted flavoprotein YhiN
MKARFAGAALKNIALSVNGETVRGEAMIASYGLEGGAIYALSARVRDAIAQHGKAILHFNLRPDLSPEQIIVKLSKARKGDSVSNVLRKTVNLTPQAIALLCEAHGVARIRDLARDPEKLAACIADAPLKTKASAPLDRAISTAGGIAWDELDERLMLRRLPGVFAAGEMLDWEAPTGGYLLQASFATGVAAAKGALALCTHA